MLKPVYKETTELKIWIAHSWLIETFRIEFSLNSVKKIFVITVKGLKHNISDNRDQDASTVPARHMWETGSINLSQFMLQWFIWFPKFAEFTEFPFNLGKIPMSATFYQSEEHSTLFHVKTHKNQNLRHILCDCECHLLLLINAQKLWK